LQAAFFLVAWAAFVALEESKVVSSRPFMVNPRQVAGTSLFRSAIFLSARLRTWIPLSAACRSIIWVLGLAVFLVAAGSVALAQNDFTLSTTQLQPPQVEPGEASSAAIDLQPVGGAGTPVGLTCAVTSTQTTQFLPACVVSPTTATPSATPSLTVNTQLASAAGLYTITVTGTSGSFTHSASLNLNVVPVTADYTMAVTKSIDPTSVAPGNGAQATITITPIGNYSGHEITLSCLGVTPVVAASPVCSFNPQPVAVNANSAPTSVLTVTTFGPATGGVGQLRHVRIFYALWLVIPGLALLGASGKRRRNILGLLLLTALAGGVLLMPACGSGQSTGTTAPNGNDTPTGSYTFTLTAVDETGAAPSNTTTDKATVTLTVTAP